MPLTSSQIDDLLSSTSHDAWTAIVKEVLSICNAESKSGSIARDIAKRDRDVEVFDLFLSSVGWELWKSFGDDVESTAARLMKWWAQPFKAKAILILDGLSLRELPILIAEASKRGFGVDSVAVTASEIPGDTNQFANAIGFANRSQLQNNGGGSADNFAPARTETTDWPWKDCANLVDASPNWLFWHQWPDTKIHALSGVGQGLDQLVRETSQHLTSDEFWGFVERLARGRNLVITSDHGYAASGLFHDASGEQAAYLKAAFKSGRNTVDDGDTGNFMPPVALSIDNRHGRNLLAVGRWKWRSQGGYPTLAHGGLSLLEVLVPFIELRKSGAK